MDDPFSVNRMQAAVQSRMGDVASPVRQMTGDLTGGYACARPIDMPLTSPEFTSAEDVKAVRLQCLELACAELGGQKLSPKDFVAWADQFFRFVMGEHGEG